MQRNNTLTIRIISPACPAKDTVILMSALAALRLMANSNLVGYGRAVSFDPCGYDPNKKPGADARRQSRGRRPASHLHQRIEVHKSSAPISRHQRIDYCAMAWRKNGHDHESGGQIVYQCGACALDFGFGMHGGLNQPDADGKPLPARARRRGITEPLRGD